MGSASSGTGSAPSVAFAARRYRGHLLGHADAGGRNQWASLTFAGVFDRFPALKAVFDATSVENAQKILAKTALDLFRMH